MPNSKARFIILKIVIAVMFAAVIWKLFDLQVLKGCLLYTSRNINLKVVRHLVEQLFFLTNDFRNVKIVI